MLIEIDPVTGTVTFLSPITHRILFKIAGGQIIIREQAEKSREYFWYVPVPMLARADGVSRLGLDPAAMEAELGVVVQR